MLFDPRDARSDAMGEAEGLARRRADPGGHVGSVTDGDRQPRRHEPSGHDHTREAPVVPGAASGRSTVHGQGTRGSQRRPDAEQRFGVLQAPGRNDPDCAGRPRRQRHRALHDEASSLRQASSPYRLDQSAGRPRQDTRDGGDLSSHLDDKSTHSCTPSRCPAVPTPRNGSSIRRRRNPSSAPDLRIPHRLVRDDSLPDGHAMLLGRRGPPAEPVSAYPFGHEPRRASASTRRLGRPMLRVLARRLAV
jgi:hypothetical protein